ncbi:hypothetical protein BDV34DRAFT_200180, partial [Aspergillus parasiticus]
MSAQTVVCSVSQTKARLASHSGLTRLEPPKRQLIDFQLIIFLSGTMMALISHLLLILID